ncbi:hypothetical protein evm_013206 [Chilo suppressalis]|nr:hypothetical protein evm_013206 [Chilo suppressalis]
MMRQFLHQKDMSEYCKRRVIPSVFLGTHVAEAHSKLLHFTNLDIPYSCFVSIRSELGSNVILVVQLLSEDSLIKGCKANPNQLLVYEMGETFGGYWGPLPESMLLPSSTVSKAYQNTNTMPSSPTQILTDTNEETTTVLTTENIKTISSEEHFIEVELPIFNLSGNFDKLLGQGEGRMKVEDIFDILYDVTPRSAEGYQTTEIPMLQFSIAQNINGRRYSSENRYNLEYGSDFLSSHTNHSTKYVTSAHHRLTFPYFPLQITVMRRTTSKKYEKIQSLRRQKSYYSVARKPKYINGEWILANNDTKVATEKIWDEIDEILKRLNETTIRNDKSTNESDNITKILESISKLNLNYSAYLHPDWNTNGNNINYTRNVANKYDFGLFTRKSLPHLTLATRNIHQTLKSTLFFNLATESSASSTVISKTRFNLKLAKNVSDMTTELIKETVENIMSNITYHHLISNNSINDSLHHLSQTQNTANVQLTPSFNSTMASVSTQTHIEENTNITTPFGINSSRTTLSGTMVDHESWENVVQAAPVMAVRLNQTVTVRPKSIDKENITHILNYTTATNMRKKRKILPIPIEDARPHKVHTRDPNETTQPPVFSEADLSQLFELQDDELHDHVALRYLRQYVGPSLFNICDFSEPKARHIFLFNSSRIAMSIGNFTLQRMTVMLTPARTLVSGNEKCSKRSLECQVFGTRVCIDKTNACDGVPNCGAYDIYDEDRLMCGAAVGLKHNVYLAAVTFIAVLLTMLYTVHYWLKRCVPKVSEAFFIYTDKAENILYLESVMRSPHDVGDNIKTMSHEHLFMTDDILFDKSTKVTDKNIFTKIWLGCVGFITCKHGKNKTTLEDIEKTMNRKMYSFTELELRTIGNKEKVDVSVQTGDSLLISNNDSVELELFKGTRQQDTRHVIKLEMPSTSSDFESRKHSMELQILKLLKGNKSKCEASCQCYDIPEVISVDEIKLQSHMYIAERNDEVTSLKPEKEIEVNSPRVETTKHIVKHLRFDEDLFTIPTSENEEDDENIHHDPLVPVDKTHKKVHDTGMSEGDEKGACREHKRFWHAKSKKSKKKTHLALH